MNLQPTLSDTLVLLKPLEASNFEVLFAAAADPILWEQHPNPNRYKREVFENFFQGAIASAGAFLILDKASGTTIGSSRYYGYNADEKSILIGYTFYARPYWGKGYNAAVKKLMIEHAFNFVDTIILHVGAENYRSQSAMAKLGAIKTQEIEVAYYGEPKRVNFEYRLEKEVI